MDWDLAQLNVARLAAPLVSPRLADFVRALEPVNREADRAPGFRWRLVADNRNGRAIEAFQARIGDGASVITNLSTWQDAASLIAYVTGGRHLDVMRRRHEFFVPMDGAAEVCWWVPRGHRPTVLEAEERLLHLRANGPTALAFSIRDPWPPPGDDGQDRG